MRKSYKNAHDQPETPMLPELNGKTAGAALNLDYGEAKATDFMAHLDGSFAEPGDHRAHKKISIGEVSLKRRFSFCGGTRPLSQSYARLCFIEHFMTSVSTGVITEPAKF